MTKKKKVSVKDTVLPPAVRERIIASIAKSGSSGASLTQLLRINSLHQLCNGLKPADVLEYHMGNDIVRMKKEGKTVFFLKSKLIKKTTDNPIDRTDSLSAQIAEVIKEFDRVDISHIPHEYKQKYSKPLTSNGKLRKIVEGIPGITVEQEGSSCFARWKVHGMQNDSIISDKYAETRGPFNTKTIDTTHSTDGTADIISFEESLFGKTASSTNNVISNEDNDQPKSTVEEFTTSFFGLRMSLNSVKSSRKFSLVDGSKVVELNEAALLGNLLPSSSHPGSEPVFLNTHEPFCFAAIGVQGAGKSHTSSCVLESCLTAFETGNVVKLKAPMTSMVLHYDQNVQSICESAGLLLPDKTLQNGMTSFGMNVSHVPKDKAVLLVSPSYYHQRKKFYGDNLCTVKPLLFRWKSLTADHIKRIMRIESGDNQLYVASFLDLLRNYQRQALVPDFPSFLREVKSVCNLKGQSGPLDQRLALLESVVAESDKNVSLESESADLFSTTKDGIFFIIADLTDPLLSKEEANGLFQVLTEQFRTLPTKGGKVLFLDEAHKYMTGSQADGLSEAIVNVARLMSHDGMRLIVSTQSPKALAPELLELVTVGCLHHFHSPDWWAYLRSKLPLNDEAWEKILSLVSGEAVVFATSHNLTIENSEGSHCLPMRIRPRITADLGSSRKNV